ncbi:MAG: hypothetical protein mread185_000692 [Mycoplasmataceae bacterium]|nr:MAG: hypothetical protein mread185_000692 [Mycoplasmataceae bacterium]
MYTANELGKTVLEWAKNINKFWGTWFMAFTTPFFAIYNTHKLMEGVESSYLRIFIFSLSIIYTIVTLLLAIYVVILKKN